MQTTRKIIVGSALVAAVAVGGAGVALASGGGGGNDDGATDHPITGPALQQATDAALQATGGRGKVTETEVGDEESYYQVEVTLDDGSHVDVQLDKDFHLVTTKHEGPERADETGPG